MALDGRDVADILATIGLHHPLGHGEPADQRTGRRLILDDTDDARHDRRRGGVGADIEVVRIEREITLGSSSAGNLHTRLLPLLRNAAAARLALDFDLHPGRARAALGDETWELLRPDRPVPEDRNAPGLPLRRVQSIVSRLERL